MPLTSVCCLGQNSGAICVASLFVIVHIWHISRWCHCSSENKSQVFLFLTTSAASVLDLPTSFLTLKAAVWPSVDLPLPCFTCEGLLLSALVIASIRFCHSSPQKALLFPITLRSYVICFLPGFLFLFSGVFAFIV